MTEIIPFLQNTIYHMAYIPDPNFDFYYALMDEMFAHKYKSRVCQEGRNHDYRKFATSREECNIVIRQNMSKVWRISGGKTKLGDQTPAQIKILNTQLKYIENDRQVAILSTCAFFIPEYNPKLIQPYYFLIVTFYCWHTNINQPTTTTFHIRKKITLLDIMPRKVIKTYILTQNCGGFGLISNYLACPIFTSNSLCIQIKTNHMVRACLPQAQHR